MELWSILVKRNSCYTNKHLIMQWALCSKTIEYRFILRSPLYDLKIALLQAI